MDVNAMGIPLAFFALMVVLCWWLVGAKGYWPIKLAAVTSALGVSLLLWKSVSGLSGWATPHELPEQFLVHWVIVHEPSRDGKSGEGGIYIWATELDVEHEVTKKAQGIRFTPDHPGEPRAYKLPYSKKLHEQVQNVAQRLRQGKPVVGKRKGLPSDEEDDEDGEEGDGEGGKKGKGKKGKGKGKAGLGGYGGFSRDQEFMFYDLPPNKMPEKVPGQ